MSIWVRGTTHRSATSKLATTEADEGMYIDVGRWWREFVTVAIVGLLLFAFFRPVWEGFNPPGPPEPASRQVEAPISR